jgi:hypothetical protein
MGQNSQSGQFGFGLQGSKGAAAAATRFARLRSGGLGGDRSLLVPDAEIGGNRDVPNAYLGPVGFSGDIEFYPRMQMISLLLYGVLGAKASSNSAGTNEVQTITTTGTPTGGTFTLTYKGATTTPIAYNAAAATIDTALEALATLEAGEVTCSGGALPTAVVVTFTGESAATNVSALTVDYSGLTGGTTPTVVVTQTTPGEGNIGTHVITPANTIPWLSMEERQGVDLESFRYTDGKVNTLRLEAEANGYLMGSAGLIALNGESGFTAQSAPDWDETPMIVGSSITVSFDGNDLHGRSFNLEFGNNIETDDFRLGSLFMFDAVAKRRALTAGISYRPEDSDIWKQAMWGAANIDTPRGGPAYRGPLTISIETYETIGNEVAGTPYSLTIEVPEATLAPFKISPSGDDVIGTDIEITAVRPDADIPLCTATVVNDLADVN